MKTLQIATDYLNAKLYVSLFNALGKTGVNNIIIVPVQQDCVYRDFNDKGLNDGSKLIITPCFTQLDRMLYFSKQKKMLAAMERTVDLESINIVHAHTLFSAGYTSMKIKEKYGIPYIVAIRNTDVNVFFKRMKHLRGAGIEVLKKASMVVFLSPAYKKQVLEKYVPNSIRDEIEGKCKIIPNGISDVFLNNMGKTHDIDKKNIKLIFAGEINKNKNLIETIEAARILKEKGINVSITVVGNVTEKSCQRWMEEPMVCHIPGCSQNMLLEYYRQADILVMPSHTETFGLVYAEAMSQGLPVIYTKGQGFDGQFPDGEVGYAVSDREPDKLADRIMQVIKNYKAMSQNAVSGTERFRWEKIACEYGEMYKKIGRHLM